MKFLVDAQLPRQLAVWLRYKGMDAVHTLDLPEQNKTDDEQIIAIAAKENRIVVTKDRDFLNGHIIKGFPRKLMLIKMGNSSNEDLLRNFAKHLPLILELIQNHNLVEIGDQEITGHS